MLSLDVSGLRSRQTEVQMYFRGNTMLVEVEPHLKKIAYHPECHRLVGRCSTNLKGGLRT